MRSKQILNLRFADDTSLVAAYEAETANDESRKCVLEIN